MASGPFWGLARDTATSHTFLIAVSRSLLALLYLHKTDLFIIPELSTFSMLLLPVASSSSLSAEGKQQHIYREFLLLLLLLHFFSSYTHAHT